MTNILKVAHKFVHLGKEGGLDARKALASHKKDCHNNKRIDNEYMGVSETPK